MLSAMGQHWVLWGMNAQCYGAALGAVGQGCSALWGSTGRCGAGMLGAMGRHWVLWGRDAQCYGVALGAVGWGCSALWGGTGRCGA